MKCRESCSGNFHPKQLTPPYDSFLNANTSTNSQNSKRHINETRACARHFENFHWILWLMTLINLFEASKITGFYEFLAKTYLYCTSRHEKCDTYFHKHFQIHFQKIFLNENCSILIKISLKFLHDDLIYNKSALIQVMAWRHTGYRPLPEPMITHPAHWRIHVHNHVLLTCQHCFPYPALAPFKEVTTLSWAKVKDINTCMWVPVTNTIKGIIWNMESNTLMICPTCNMILVQRATVASRSGATLTVLKLKVP